MNINLESILPKLMRPVNFFKRYAVFTSVIVFLFITTFFVFRINQYSRMEPDESTVEEKLQTVQRPKVDQSVLNKIQQLQDQNIQVKTLFDQTRSNPFNE